MDADSRIDFVIPGLFGPVPVLPEDLPDLPRLARLLGRADRTPEPGSDPITVLFERFGIELSPDRDPPSAPFSRLADGSNAACDGFWLHADPVHMRPDRDRLLLFDARHLDLEREEIDFLVELFNGHFAADGLRLEAPADTGWYLRAEQAPHICTTPIADVVGRSLERSFLRGEDAACWIGWLNEAQMLFYHSNVNRSRELAGRPTVSGVWPWGGGSLPAVMPPSRYGSVFAGDSLAVGLAKAVGAAVYPLPGNPEELPVRGRQGRKLLFWDALWPSVLDGDGTTWVRELSRLSSWLDHLVGRLTAGEVGEIALFPCDGTRVDITRGTLRRFWRRPVGIVKRLQGMRTG